MSKIHQSNKEVSFNPTLPENTTGERRKPTGTNNPLPTQLSAEEKGKRYAIPAELAGENKKLKEGESLKKMTPYIKRAGKIASSIINNGEIFIYLNDHNLKLHPELYPRTKSDGSEGSLLDVLIDTSGNKSLLGVMEIHLVAEDGQDQGFLSKQILPAMLALSGYLAPEENSGETQENRDGELIGLLRQEGYENSSEILQSAKSIRENIVKANFVKESEKLYPFVAHRNATQIIGSYLSEVKINSSSKISQIAEKCYQINSSQPNSPDSVIKLREEVKRLNEETARYAS